MIDEKIIFFIVIIINVDIEKYKMATFLLFTICFPFTKGKETSTHI